MGATAISGRHGTNARPIVLGATVMGQTVASHEAQTCGLHRSLLDRLQLKCSAAAVSALSRWSNRALRRRMFPTTLCDIQSTASDD